MGLNSLQINEPIRASSIQHRGSDTTIDLFSENAVTTITIGGGSGLTALTLGSTGSVLTLRDTVDVAGRGSAPGLSAAGSARYYFDTILNKLRVSENGAAYTDMVGGGGGGGDDLATVLEAGNITDGEDIIISTGDEIVGQTILTLTTTPGGLTSGNANLTTGNTVGDGASSGNVLVATGSAEFGTTGSAATGSLTIQTGVFTGTTSDQGDTTGSILIQVGGGVTLVGEGAVGGGVEIRAGGTQDDNSQGGSMSFFSGDAGGTNSTAGDMTFTAGSGYTAGDMTFNTGVPGPGNGGEMVFNSGANMQMTAQETFGVRSGDSGSNGSMLFEAKGNSGEEIRFIRNPGTPTTQAWLDDQGWHVSGGPIFGDLGDGTGSVNVATQSGSMGGNGTSLYITPNLGIILEIGNTIKMDPDGTNNWIYGDDGAAASNDPGEPLTLRGGHGDGSGDGAPLRLFGGNGGNTTGDGAGVEIAPGSTTGGTAGTVSVCTQTTHFLRFYGTAAGVAQQTVTGSRGANAALADLLTALAALGLIVDGTSA